MQTNIPTGWKKSRLDDLAADKPFAIVDGPFGTQLHQDEYVDEGVPVVRIVNLSFAGEFNPNEIVYVSKRKAVELSRSAVEPGDIILAKTGATIGKLAMFPSYFDAGLIASSCIKMTTDRTRCDPNYLLYVLASEFGQLAIRAVAGGSTRSTINNRPFGGIEILHPVDIEEQRRIANVLQSVDLTIRQTEGQIEKLNQMKAGLLHDLLTRGLDERGELRDPTSYPQKFKDSPLGKIPKEWGVDCLGCLAINGISNGFFKKPELVGSGYRLINVLDLYQGFGVQLATVERVNADENEWRKYSVEPGDCFFTRSSLNLAGIAHCNLVREVTEPALFECHLMRVRPDQSKVIPEFLAHWCRSTWARKYLMQRAKQVTMTTISQPDISPLSVPIPPKSEQARIVEAIDIHDARIRAEEAYCEKLKQLKKGLMEDLLTGKVQINVKDKVRS